MSDVFSATGRRKESVARVRLVFPGTGTQTVNGRPLDGYFGRRNLVIKVRQPLEYVDMMDSMDVIAKVNGGGISGQAGAVRLGIARATRVPILYGGSVKPGNAAELLAAPEVDGVLVGGASLDAESYANIEELIRCHSTNESTSDELGCDFADLAAALQNLDSSKRILIEDLISLMQNKTTYPTIRIDQVDIEREKSGNCAEVFHPFVGRTTIAKDDDSLEKIIKNLPQVQ